MRGLQFLIKFSYRNLWRSPKRTMIMLLSLSVGSGFIIWNLNFANSGSKEMMKEFLSQYAGQFHITNPAYYGTKENRKDFNNYKTMNDDMLEDKSLMELSTRRVTAPVFVSGEKKTLGVLLTGLEVQKELETSFLHKAVTTGRHLDPNGSREIIIGKKFADKINVKIGDEVAVVGQALDGSVANDLLKVVGLLDFGGGDMEDSLAFTQISTARELMAMDNSTYHQLVSFDMDRDHLPVLKNLGVVKWDELLPEIGVSVRFIDNMTWTTSIIIVLVISLGLSNTLMITFFEREQEFQSLNIIGAQGGWITKSLMIEVFIMGSLALILGSFIGWAMTTYCFYHPIDITIFTGGNSIIMGGMVIKPVVKIYPITRYFFQVPLMIYFFLTLTMIYPLIRVIQRSKHAI